MTIRTPSIPERKPAPLGVWLVARTPTSRTYPCRCWLGKRCTARCPCSGRTDIGLHLPAHCCANPPP